MTGFLMNDHQIESLLRKAPVPPPPVDLLNQLLVDIALKRPEANSSCKALWLSFQQWWPAAACLVIGVAVLGSQAHMATMLRRENDRLQAAAAHLDDLRHENVEYQRLALAASEAERLRADLAEVRTLSAEVAQIRQSLSEKRRLEIENQQLLRELNLPDEQPLEQEGAAGEESARCVNNLSNISLGAGVYAADNDNRLPPDFLTMTNELGTPKILLCPSDLNRRPRDGNGFTWKDFTEANNSYEMLTPGAVLERPGPENGPPRVFVRCRIHGHVILMNGTVRRSNSTWSLVQKDGHWIQEHHEK